MMYVNFGTKGVHVRNQILSYARTHGLDASHWQPGPTWCVRSMTKEPLVEVLTMAGFDADAARSMADRAEQRAIQFGYMADPLP